MSLNTLKWAAVLCFVIAMIVLLGGGAGMKKSLPPYPDKVVGPNGNLMFTKADIIDGQNVYQRFGLMDHGAVWGHGSQRGPEFSAATLNLVAESVGEHFAQKEYGRAYTNLEDLQREMIDVRIKNEIKTNRYDAAADTLTLTSAQVLALNHTQAHWDKVFKQGDTVYGILPGTIPDEQQRLQVSRFFFWTAWIASTLRPGKDYTYTNNWPPDRRVGNVAFTAAFGLNGGLLLMAMGTLLPVGAMQAWASFKEGLWVARSAEFFSKGAVVTLGTLRAIPDVIIIVFGVLPLAYFLIITYPRLKAKTIGDNESVWEKLGIEL